MKTFLVKAEIDLTIVAENEEDAENLLFENAPTVHCFNSKGESIETEEGGVKMLSVEEFNG